MPAAATACTSGRRVIDAGGVVGQIIAVEAGSATVLLITDPDHAVPVAVARNGVRLVAYGTGRSDRLALAEHPAVQRREGRRRRRHLRAWADDSPPASRSARSPRCARRKPRVPRRRRQARRATRSRPRRAAAAQRAARPVIGHACARAGRASTTTYRQRRPCPSVLRPPQATRHRRRRRNPPRRHRSRAHEPRAQAAGCCRSAWSSRCCSALLPLPAQLQPLRPYWLALVRRYWVIEEPDRVGLGFAFVIGLLADLPSAACWANRRCA